MRDDRTEWCLMNLVDCALLTKVHSVLQNTKQSADVIHSFWIPSLGGKVDMIPVDKRVSHLNRPDPEYIVARAQSIAAILMR